MTVPEGGGAHRELFERKSPEAILEDLLDFAERVQTAYKRVNPPKLGERLRGVSLQDLIREFFEQLSPDVLRDALGVEDGEVRSYRDLDAILRALEDELEERREDLRRVRHALGKYLFSRTYVLGWLAVRVTGKERRSDWLMGLVSRLVETELLAEEAALIASVVDAEDVREWAEEYLEELELGAVLEGAEPEEEAEAPEESGEEELTFGEDRLEPEPKLEVCVVRGRLPRFVDPDTGAVVPDARAGDLLVVGGTAAGILSERGRRWGGPFARMVRR